MAIVMTNKEFVAKLEKVAKNYKTLYVMGCIGAPLNASNKERYCKNHEYNRDPSRKQVDFYYCLHYWGAICCRYVNNEKNIKNFSKMLDNLPKCKLRYSQGIKNTKQ